MPRARRAPKRPRATPKPKDPVWEIVKRLHLPMIEARAFMSALHLMGYRMDELGNEDGETVKTLAGAARKRLDVIREGVTDLVQMAKE